MRQVLATTLTALITIGPLLMPEIASAGPNTAGTVPGRTATPIKHLVIIFQESVSFDHYFGTSKSRKPEGRAELPPIS